MQNELRKFEHSRSSEVEAIIQELSNIVGSVEPDASNFLKSSFKNCFIIGCARSGTTFLHQSIIEKLNVCYPTNFLSRLYYAPYIGALYQKLFYDLDTKKELFKAIPPIDKVSELGKTIGPMSPNEFWYFWRHYFRINEQGYLQAPKPSELKEFYSGLNKIKSVFNKPIVLKGLIANNCFAQLSNYNESDLFIYIKRKKEDNAKSLLESRIKFFGSEEQWYSFKVNDYEKIKALTPMEQVIHQVEVTNEMIVSQLSRVKNVIEIDYEDFVDLPENWICKIAEQLNCEFRK